MLTSVSLVLRGNSVLEGLENNARSIADFLGPSSALSLSEACNYWQFDQPLHVAAILGDAKIVKWLMEHFEGCQAPPSIAEAAARGGHLGVLQVLLRNSRPTRPSPQARNVVCWGNEALFVAADNDQIDTARWLYDNVGYGLDAGQRARLIGHALSAGGYEFADRLLPTNGSKCVLDFDRMPKWTRRRLCDPGFGEDMKIMQQILLLHSPPTKEIEDDEEWMDEWCTALVNATRRGDFGMVQWLVEYPNGQNACTRSTEARGRSQIDDILSEAGERGHTEVIRYLEHYGAKDPDSSALVNAIRGGHLSSVKILLQRFSYESLHGKQDRAVMHGSDLFGDSSDESDQPEPRKGEQSSELWRSAAKLAARSGQVEVLDWIYRNHKLELPPGIFDKVTIRHGGVAQWLKETWPNNFAEVGIDTGMCMANEISLIRPEDEMNMAARNGNLEVIKRLVATRQATCTSDTLEEALLGGHVRVAYWIHAHFPGLELPIIQLTKFTANIFEILLFVRENYADVTSEIIAHYFTVEQPMDNGAFPADPFCHVEQWLEDNYFAEEG